MYSGAAQGEDVETPYLSVPMSPPSEAGQELKRRRRESSPEDSEAHDNHKRKRRQYRRSTPSDSDPLQLPTVTVSANLLDSDYTQRLKFSPGAIIAMRLVNFQVSRDATYRFEPYLNMILGSNGTGKSTVVTAIFLLFQGRVRDLDRSTHGEFVTIGQERAVLSAVLQSRTRRSKQNHVVAMVIPSAKITGTQQALQWYVDGLSVGEAAFTEFIASYHIHVNNLSQFLPQTRIASFAGLSPEDRLTSIEEAVGYDGMIDDHKLLANRGNELVEIDRDVDLYTKRLEDLRARHAELEAKLSQLGSVQEEKGHLEYLDQVLKISEYFAVEGHIADTRDALDKAREDLRNFDSEHRNVSEEIAKADYQISELDRSFNGAEGALKEAENALVEQQQRTRDAREALSQQLNTVKELRNERDGCKNKIEKLEKEHHEILVSIARSRKLLNELGDAELFAQRENKLAVLQDRRDAVRRRRREAQEQSDTAQAKLTTTLQSLARSTQKLKQLENAQNLQRPLGRIQQLVHWDRGNLERAVVFVRRHKDKFKLPVIEPAIVSVDVVDPRVLPMIASVLPVSQMFKFVCQCREDMVTLTNLASGTDGIEVKAVLLDNNSSSLPDIAVQALKRTGFDGVLSEAVSGPGPVVSFLSSLGLGYTPYSLSPCTEAARNELKSLYGQFRGFVDPEMHYSFQQSRYGRRMETEASQAVGPAPNWAKFMVRRDTSAEENALKQTILDSERDVAQIERDVNGFLAQLDVANKEQEEADADFVEIHSKVKMVQANQAKLASSVRKESKITAELQQQKSRQVEQADLMSRLVQDLTSAVIELGKLEVDEKDLSKLLREAHENTLLQVRRKDLERKKHFLSSSLRVKRQTCEVAVTQLETDISTQQEATRLQHRQSEEATSWLRAHKKLKEGVKQARAMSVAELQVEIGRRRSLLDMRDAHGESFAVAKNKLNSVVDEMRDLERNLVNLKARRLNVTTEVNGTRQKWETALEQMVFESSTTFQKMFSQLRCRGSVSVSRPDLLAVGTWGLDVNVAFRENEPEQRLSRNRQSGGERSVTTAVYLMSLQRMSQAPFRVLDEINQGMDKQNETKTMAFIVDNSCNHEDDQGRAQQYFVVTPKLLFDMPYHRRMSINFIISSNKLERSTELVSSVEQDALERLIEEEALSDG